MFALVLPYVLWLRRRHRLQRLPVGAGIAAIGAAVWTFGWQMTLRPPSLAASLATGAAIGLAVGLVFCRIVACRPADSSG
jgi:drug/metabolite transporter (DMT)-like permease